MPTLTDYLKSIDARIEAKGNEIQAAMLKLESSCRQSSQFQQLLSSGRFRLQLEAPPPPPEPSTAAVAGLLTAEAEEAPSTAARSRYTSAQSSVVPSVVPSLLGGRSLSPSVVSQ